MSRNLCTSSCPHCGRKVTLADVRGKPIEFRRYGPYVPDIGCRWDCDCGVAYFVIWRQKDKYWGDELLPHAHKEEFPRWVMPAPHHKNSHPGKFYHEYEFPRLAGMGLPKKNIHRVETGTFTLDLSYYETYNDEQINDPEREAAIRDGKEKPWHLCEDDAEDVYLEW